MSHSYVSNGIHDVLCGDSESAFREEQTPPAPHHYYDRCAYCGSELARYDPVFVEETEDGDRLDVGGFCNYACLHEWTEDEDELTDACCTIGY